MTSYSNSKLNLPKNIKKLKINIPSYETVIKTISKWFYRYKLQRREGL